MKILRPALFVFFLLFTLISCGLPRQIIKHYKGKSQEELELTMGKPTRIEIGDSGEKIYVYIKNKYLKAAPINTGAYQYDKFISPHTVKTETYTFYLNKSKVVEKVTYDYGYTR